MSTAGHGPYARPMSFGEMPGLSRRQTALLHEWLPGAEIVHDHSWGLVATTVLEVVRGDVRLIVKAGGEQDSHIQREVRAHRNWLEPWTARGRAPSLVHADAAAKVLVTRYLPGCLVLGDSHADDPDTYRQAGALLADLHRQSPQQDRDYERRENAKALAWLDGPHRIDADTTRRLRTIIASWPDVSTTVVPTHGDWQPRNWLVHAGSLSVIDFGRADLRPAMSDLTRLAAQEFRCDASLEAAFLDGYGTDPRKPAAWHRTRVREAVGTACWAYAAGDAGFEAQGHRMIADVLSGR